MRLALFDVGVEKRVAKYKVLEKIVCRLVANVSVLRLKEPCQKEWMAREEAAARAARDAGERLACRAGVDVLPWSRDLRNGCV